MSEAELGNEEVEEQDNEENNVIKIRKRKRKDPETRPEGNFEFLMEIFDEAQRDRAYHDANTNEITERFEGGENAERLCETWKPLLQRLLIRFKTDQPTSKLEKFVVKVATSQNNGPAWSDIVFSKLMSWLLTFVNSKEKAVRFRVCSLIGCILNEMSETAEIDENLWGELENRLLDRFQDRIKEVRKAAAHALTRLQNSESPKNCPITQQFLFTIAHDKDKEVRLECVKKIDLNRTTVSEVVYRVRDECPRVRKEVFTRLESVEMRAFSIRQRVSILDSGLTDRDESVRANCSKLLLKKWLPGVKFDIIQFLIDLDCETYHELLDPIVFHILDSGIDYQERETYKNCEKLTAEIVFLWRAKCEYLHKHKAIEALEEELPDAKEFCTILENNKTNEFIAHQLLKLTNYLDVSDEFGRNRFVRQCRDLMKDLDMRDALVPDIMKILRKLHHNEEEDLTRMLREDISEIRDPLVEENSENQLSPEEKKVIEERMEVIDKEREKLLARIEELSRDRLFGECQKKQDKAAELEDEFQDLYAKLNAEQLLHSRIYERTFNIIIDLLMYTNLNHDHGMIATIEQDLIMPVWKTELWTSSPEIRELGVKSLGVFCMISKDFALQHLWLFYNLSKEDDEVAFVMLQTLLDFMFRFEFTDEELENAVNPLTQNEGVGGGKLMLTNYKLVDHIFSMLKPLEGEENLETKRVVVEGLCKLLMCNKLKHKRKEILTKLLLIYFTPHGIVVNYEEDNDEAIESAEYRMDKEERIRQSLSLFFPIYAKRKANIKEGCQENLIRVLIDCIYTISAKPSKHPLRQIPRSKLINYVLWLLGNSNSDDNIRQEQDQPFHNQVVTRVIKALSLGTTTEQCRSFCTILANLTFNQQYGKEFKQSQNKVYQITPNIVDKAARRDWDKFRKGFDACIKIYDETPHDPETIEEAEESNNKFQNYTQEAAKQHELHTQAKDAPVKRRSLPISQSISSPTLRGGKKRKLTNTKRSIETLEDESDDDIVIQEISSPPSPVNKKKTKKNKKSSSQKRKRLSPMKKNNKKQKVDKANVSQKKRQRFGKENGEAEENDIEQLLAEIDEEDSIGN